MYAGGSASGRNPSVTIKAFALYEEVVEVDHLLGAGVTVLGPLVGGVDDDGLEGRDIPYGSELWVDSVSLFRVVASHVDPLLDLEDRTELARLEANLKFSSVSAALICERCNLPKRK